MEDDDVRVRSRISAAHKIFAVLLGAAVAAAGYGWLVLKSRTSASTAVLAFNPALAQHIDRGIGSAKHPAVVLADLVLNDKTVENLAKDAHLASSTPAGRVGEFRSDLQLTQSSAQRLDVRFQAAEPSQSMAVANAVAHALAAWNPTDGATSAPSGGEQSAAPPASEMQPAAPANEGSSDAPTVAAPAPEPAPRALHKDHGLSNALTKVAAKLSAADQQLDRLPSGGEESSYNESRQQLLLRAAVRDAQRTLEGLRTRYAKEVAEPKVSAWFNEIEQALKSVLPETYGSGLNAARGSQWELSPEHSGLRQAIRIMKKETERIRNVEAADSASGTEPATPATSTSQGTAPATPPISKAAAPVSPTTQPASVVETAASLSPAAQSASSSGEEQDTAPTPPASQAPQEPADSPLTIVRLAAPKPPPPLLPAIVAGALCGLLYLGIMGLGPGRVESDDDYSETGLSLRHTITPSDPIGIDRLEDSAAEKQRFETAPRQFATFDLRRAPADSTDAPIRKPVASGETMPAPMMKLEAPSESASVSTQTAGLAPPVEAIASPGDRIAEPAAEVTIPAQGIVAPARSATAAGALSRSENGSFPELRLEPPAEPTPQVLPPESTAGTDSVADHLREILAGTPMGQLARGFDKNAAKRDQAADEEESRDSLAGWFSRRGKF